MRVTKLNDEALVADDSVVQLAAGDMHELKEASRHNARHRIRICAHKGTSDRLHEMFIVHSKGTYVRPHKHPGKSESLYVIEGAAEAVFFDEGGAVRQAISLGDYPSSKVFYYRIDEPWFHTLIISSDVFVFHEVTNGPFDRDQTIFAPWAPTESDIGGQNTFIENLFAQIRSVAR